MSAHLCAYLLHICIIIFVCRIVLSACYESPVDRIIRWLLHLSMRTICSICYALHCCRNDPSEHGDLIVKIEVDFPRTLSDEARRGIADTFPDD